MEARLAANVGARRHFLLVSSAPILETRATFLEGFNEFFKAPAW